MTRMRFAFAAAWAPVLLAGCLMREGNLDNIGVGPSEWSFPGSETEFKVFGPVAIDEVKGFVRGLESDGWAVVGFEPASLPEDVMVNHRELDQPKPGERGAWTFDLPKTMPREDPDSSLAPPPGKTRIGEEYRRVTANRVDGPKGQRVDSIPPYLDEGVRPHRQKYLVVARRWR
jgi:hypothetical protein